MCDKTNPLNCEMSALEFALGITRELANTLQSYASILSQPTSQKLEEAMNNMAEVALLASARAKRLHGEDE
jgi:hypothetical protein